MGVVYQAQDPHIDRLIAVKVMRRDRMENESFVKRFMKEAKVIGRLSHPQVVTIYDVGEEEGEIYIAMEFLEGTPLSDVVREGRLESGKIVELGIQIAETLDYAHRKGVIHRDIKPSNIVIEPDGRAKITDFGIAHIEDSSATLQTQTGMILGTPAYMSPEQVLGNQVDGRSDIFSLGVILYELSTGKRPFGGEGKTLATMFNDIMVNIPQEPHATTAAVSPELSGIIMKALQKEPADRFQTGKEMAEALRSYHEKPGQKPELVSVMASPAQKKKPDLAVPIFFAVMLMAVIGGGYYVFQGRPTPPQSHPPQAKATPSDVAKPPPPHLEPKPSLPSSTPEVDSAKNKKPVEKPSVLPQQQDTKREEKKEVKEKTPPPENAKPLPRPATLSLRTAPLGASVHIDGKPKGTTPLSLKLPKGEHRIRVTLAGYEKMEKHLTMEDGKTYSLTLSLKTVAESDGWVVKPLVDRPQQ